jgi:FixJ family two-component response regulator
MDANWPRRSFGFTPRYVVFMSGHIDDEVLRRDVSYAETWYIQKPFTPDMLHRKVREALDAHPRCPRGTRMSA